MAQYQISLDSEKVKDLMIRDDGLKGLVQDVLNRTLEAQATEAVGAERYERSEGGGATVISYISDNDLFKAKIEPFSVIRFPLELTQHIPLRISQYTQRYGLSSHTIRLDQSCFERL